MDINLVSTTIPLQKDSNTDKFKGEIAIQSTDTRRAIVKFYLADNKNYSLDKHILFIEPNSTTIVKVKKKDNGAQQKDKGMLHIYMAPEGEESATEMITKYNLKAYVQKKIPFVFTLTYTMPSLPSDAPDLQTRIDSLKQTLSAKEELLNSLIVPEIPPKSTNAVKLSSVCLLSAASLLVGAFLRITVTSLF